ncbi:MAG: YraN family protein [Lachnospiraceae bacterium]|nr:YraN family protein [Lachnospiraceae bacterium]MBO7338490.1 YraN family protein [Lachnospiraceae bacterium]MCR5499107.1 YraN family protein [Acetatifactor sp.]
MNKRRLGADKEEAAARYLTQHGARVLAKNYRCRQGEIDLVAQDGEYLVFCEVKFRKDHAMGTPGEAVGYQKQKKICRVAAVYRTYHGISLGTAIRYDVIAIEGDQITWIKNAFPHCE